MRVPDEVIAYLLTHVRRDLRSLTAILDQLDRVSLETQAADHAAARARSPERLEE